MDYLEAVVHTTTDGADIVSEALMNAGAVGTQIVDRADIPSSGQREEGYWELIDESLVASMPEDVLVKAYFEENVRAPEVLATVRERMEALAQMELGIGMGTLRL